MITTSPGPATLKKANLKFSGVRFHFNDGRKHLGRNVERDNTKKIEHGRRINVPYKRLHASPLQRDVLAGVEWRCSSPWALDRCWSQYVYNHQRLAHTFACSRRKRSEQFDATILGKRPVPFPSQGRERAKYMRWLHVQKKNGKLNFQFPLSILHITINFAHARGTQIAGAHEPACLVATKST
jgi:hypothetical protein